MKVFIAGPRAVSKLNRIVEKRLYNIYSNDFTVFVGDANGVDKLIQKFYLDLNYRNVVVFASKGQARNNMGNWPIESVLVDEKVKGFKFYAQKDIAMAKKADYGFMIWNGKSKGTLNNILNLISENKKVLIYFIPQDKFISIDNKVKLERLISICPLETMNIFRELSRKLPNIDKQVLLHEILNNGIGI